MYKYWTYYIQNKSILFIFENIYTYQIYIKTIYYLNYIYYNIAYIIKVKLYIY